MTAEQINSEVGRLLDHAKLCRDNARRAKVNGFGSECQRLSMLADELTEQAEAVDPARSSTAWPKTKQ